MRIRPLNYLVLAKINAYTFSRVQVSRNVIEATSTTGADLKNSHVLQCLDGVEAFLIKIYKFNKNSADMSQHNGIIEGKSAPPRPRP